MELVKRLVVIVTEALSVKNAVRGGSPRKRELDREIHAVF